MGVMDLELDGISADDKDEAGGSVIDEQSIAVVGAGYYF
jgi:hypothetical protein